MVNKNKLWDIFTENDGFSLNAGFWSPKTGYMVSLPGHETVKQLSDIDKDSLWKTFVEYWQFLPADSFMNPSGKLWVGCWVDEDKVYFDISENVQDKQQAINLGKERKQIAVFDLRTFESIYLEREAV